MEDLKVAPIRNGTVIDHIRQGQALNVLKIIGIKDNTLNSSVILAMHVPSKRIDGWKDVVKVEDCELDEGTVDKIALIAPEATIVIIRDYSVAEKYHVQLHDHVKGLAKCSNPNCITNLGEPVEPEFDVVCSNPPTLRCMYCERSMTDISDNLL